MSAIDYLRGVMKRDIATPATPAAAPTPPRDIPWTNRTDISGSCPCIGIYSECRCTPK